MRGKETIFSRREYENEYTGGGNNKGMQGAEKVTQDTEVRG